MKIKTIGLIIVIFSSIALLIFTMTVLIDINHAIGYDEFYGKISNVTTTKSTCSTCLETDYHNNCITHQDITCYSNTIYAINTHTTCSLIKIIKDLSNQQHFLSSTKIGDSVNWYKSTRNHKCTTNISDSASLLSKLIIFTTIGLVTFYCYGWVLMFETNEISSGNKYTIINLEIEFV